MGNWDSYDWLVYSAIAAVILLTICMIVITISFMVGIGGC